MSEGSFDGNPYGDCVSVRACVIAGSRTALFLAWLLETLLHHQELRIINFSLTSSILSLCSPQLSVFLHILILFSHVISVSFPTSLKVFFHVVTKFFKNNLHLSCLKKISKVSGLNSVRVSYYKVQLKQMEHTMAMVLIISGLSASQLVRLS